MLCPGEDDSGESDAISDGEDKKEEDIQVVSDDDAGTAPTIPTRSIKKEEKNKVFPQRTPKRKRIGKVEEDLILSLTSTCDEIKSDDRNKVDFSDPVTLFCLSLVKDLRGLEETTYDMAKLRIMQAVHQTKYPTSNVSAVYTPMVSQKPPMQQPVLQPVLQPMQQTMQQPLQHVQQPHHHSTYGYPIMEAHTPQRWLAVLRKLFINLNKGYLHSRIRMALLHAG